MELHYQTFFRKKLTDIKGISDQKADKIQSEEGRNWEWVQKVKNEFEWNLVINVGVVALLLIDYSQSSAISWLSSIGLG